MFTHKLHDTISAAAKVACALSLAMACTPAWAEDNKPKFEMSVFTDAPQGSKILSGKYDQAITKINARSQSSDTLHVQTNLCVAYTKAGEIDAAQKACDEAVAAAKTLRKVRNSPFIGEPPSRVRARYLAITLSNRGVVKAVRGDLEAAKKDFDAALAQTPEVSSVQTNLERLEAANDDAV